MINNIDKYISLRNTFQEFHYENFDYSLIDNELSIGFNFRVDDFIEFHPSLKFVKSQFYHFENIPTDVLEAMIFNIGMVELISYWKAIAPKKLIIHGYKLGGEQIDFWKKLYFHGLGEYFYLNGIDPDFESFISINSLGDKILKPFDFNVSENAIIPVGGGKDSVVSLELLKDLSKDNLALIMNPRGASLATAIEGGFENRLLEIRRTIDPELIRLNNEGFLNGHTPFSALLAFVTLIAAAASGRKHIALSNEGSANEPTVAGTKINHQYSKSIEFEADFRNYVQNNISGNLNYFSLLRPISELQIASIFSRHPKYFDQFKSCNVGSKSDIWCGKCPKCLFTFIILSPFLEPEILVRIFGSNLLEDNDLEKYFDELTGIVDVKPFECIGTVEEVNIAICLAKKKYHELPFLLKKHDSFFDKKYCRTALENLNLNEISIEHFLEEKFLKILTNSL